MKSFSFKNPKFIKSGVKPEHYPKVRLPEIATAGRSNVGKSTLLNDLFQRKNMVKASATPGKTQHINFFTVEDSLSIVDLPGYGYARVPDKVKKQWGPMVQSYLEEREDLKLILFLIDVRRTPNEDDLRFFEWVCYHGYSLVLVITKVDKVKQNEKVKRTKAILDAFGSEGLQYVHYSATKRVGRRELIKMINEALREELLGEEDGATE